MDLSLEEVTGSPEPLLRSTEGPPHDERRPAETDPTNTSHQRWAARTVFVATDATRPRRLRVLFRVLTGVLLLATGLLYFHLYRASMEIARLDVVIPPDPLSTVALREAQDESERMFPMNAETMGQVLQRHVSQEQAPLLPSATSAQTVPVIQVAHRIVASPPPARVEEVPLHATLGHLHARAQHWDEAREAYARALALDEAGHVGEPDPNLAFNLAVVLEHLGRKAEALESYRLALDATARRRPGFDPALAQARVRALSGT